MQVNKDSYVTLDEANAYINSRYPSKSKDATRWASLSDEDKEAYLLTACAQLELLPWQGRAASSDQPMMWPRLPYQYLRANGAPDPVKDAQIELALWLSDEAKRSKQGMRRELQEQGVTSFSLDGLSETYADTVAQPVTLACEKAKTLVSRYLSGSYQTA
jgi:hypothetical protein